jgi:hypothetical protein
MKTRTSFSASSAMHYDRSQLGAILIGMPASKSASPGTRSSTAGLGSPTGT